MGLEAGTYLNDLVPANPDGADSKAEGDNHIRLLKTVLQNTFPGMAGRIWRHQTKSGGYAPALTDNMTVFNCTAALTLSPVAAATLGNGWLALVHANGGDVTIDPNGAETINGFATIVVPNSMCAVLLCDGTALKAFIIPTVAPWTTGDVKVTFKTVADAGWVVMNDGTIGSGASAATTRANADTEALFTLLWNNTADAQCAVSGGRGANAAADFAANKTIALPKALGRALAVSGAGAGLTARVLALAFGSEAVGDHQHPAGTLAADSNGAHQHGPGSHTSFIVTDNTGGAGVGGAGFSTFSENLTASAGAHTHTISGNTASNTGAGTAGNIPPQLYANVHIKL